jgi:hypothetical protein
MKAERINGNKLKGLITEFINCLRFSTDGNLPFYLIHIFSLFDQWYLHVGQKDWSPGI